MMHTFEVEVDVNLFADAEYFLVMPDCSRLLLGTKK